MACRPCAARDIVVLNVGGRWARRSASSLAALVQAPREMLRLAGMRLPLRCVPLHPSLRLFTTTRTTLTKHPESMLAGDQTQGGQERCLLWHGCCSPDSAGRPTPTPALFCCRHVPGRHALRGGGRRRALHRQARCNLSPLWSACRPPGWQRRTWPGCQQRAPMHASPAGCRDPQHFSCILSFLRDGRVPIPEGALERQQLRAEASFFALVRWVAGAGCCYERAAAGCRPAQLPVGTQRPLLPPGPSAPDGAGGSHRRRRGGAARGRGSSGGGAAAAGRGGARASAAGRAAGGGAPGAIAFVALVWDVRAALHQGAGAAHRGGEQQVD